MHRIHELHNRSGASHVPGWIIPGRANRNAYVLGLAPPALPRRYLEHGDVYKAPSIDALAATIDVPADRLRTSVQTFNRYAESGVDPDFHRGESAYDRLFVDTYFRNPNLAMLSKPPFCAIRLYPGDIGTRGATLSPARAQVLNGRGRVIERLWVTGNSMAPVMGHSYPGPGANLGPSMAFGYIAALSAAGKLGAV